MKSYDYGPPMGPAVGNDAQATGPKAQQLPFPFPHPMNINTRPALVSVTAASTKADIIDAASELVSIQADQIADLQDRQLVLWALVGVLSVLLLLGA